MQFPIQRAGEHERFFSSVLRFAYARRFIHVGVNEPMYPDLADTALRGIHAIERGDMEAMFCATTTAEAELRRILVASKPAERRRHY